MIVDTAHLVTYLVEMLGVSCHGAEVRNPQQQLNDRSLCIRVISMDAFNS